MINQTDLNILILLFAILAVLYYMIWIFYMIEYTKRKKAEKFIFIQLEGKMEDYKEFQKYF